MARFVKTYMDGRHDPYNGQGITLAVIRGKEVIVNGQNRMAALALCAGKLRGLVFDVCTGVKPLVAIQTIDTNLGVRTLGDSIKIATGGEAKNDKLAGSVARYYVSFETSGGWRTLPPISTILIEPVDNDLVVMAYEEEPLIADVVDWSRSVFNQASGCPSIALTAFCWLILRRRDDLRVGEVDAFFEAVGSGIGLGSVTDPAYLLRQRFPAFRGNLKSSNRALLVYFTLRAFRAAHRKERLKKLQAPNETTTMRFIRP